MLVETKQWCNSLIAGPLDKKLQLMLSCFIECSLPCNARPNKELREGKVGMLVGVASCAPDWFRHQDQICYAEGRMFINPLHTNCSV